MIISKLRLTMFYILYSSMYKVWGYSWCHIWLDCMWFTGKGSQY